MYQINDDIPLGCIYESEDSSTKYCPMCNRDDVPYCQWFEDEPEAAIGIDERPVYCPILPSAQPEPTTEIQEILNYLDTALHPIVSPDNWNVYAELHDMISKLPPAQPEKEIPKRVLWSGWKGVRDTRYKCPNCKKPVRNTDIYCHRCGQKLMFPNISFTPYIEGQKQELIVRWDDEE